MQDPSTQYLFCEQWRDDVHCKVVKRGDDFKLAGTQRSTEDKHVWSYGHILLVSPRVYIRQGDRASGIAHLYPLQWPLVQSSFFKHLASSSAKIGMNPGAVAWRISRPRGQCTNGERVSVISANANWHKHFQSQDFNKVTSNHLNYNPIAFHLMISINGKRLGFPNLMKCIFLASFLFTWFQWVQCIAGACRCCHDCKLVWIW